MDPVTAIGLASGILSFITFSVELVQGSVIIHNAADGNLEENRSRELIIQEMKQFSAKLLAPDNAALVGEEKALCLLAAECQTLSNDLIALLERIKPKDPGSKAQSAWSALKNVIHEKEKLELEERLDRCRNQLELQITFLTSRETRASLNNMLSIAKTDSNTLLRLQRNIEDLSQGIEVSFISEKAQSQIRKLLGVQEEVLEAITRQRILKAISFDGMNGRYNMLEDAYTKTFEWIFGDAYPREEEGGQDKKDGEEDAKSEQEGGGDMGGGTSEEGKEEDAAMKYTGESIRGHDKDDVETDGKAIHMKKEAREKFMRWLSSENGIFHISGKLGSGKSTLMRFLYEHRGTKAELEKWAGDKSVVLSGFFFWNPGSEMQKSLAGLFRSLLHGILQECPEFIPQVLPARWYQASRSPLQTQADIEITEKEIQSAFDLLIKNKALYKDKWFCLFIDGLDEFQETPSKDRRDMIKIIKGWTKDSGGLVKLVVSSREDNVFMNAFSDRRFRLHELTRHDMRSYVRDKLSHLTDSENKKKLVEAIPERAQGIFLWVSLVSKAMREELENGASVESLWEMLETLPEELYALFEHLLRSLSNIGRKRAYRTLDMLLLSKTNKIPFYVLGYSFFEAYGSDHEFAVKEKFRIQASAVRGDGDVIAQRTDLGQKQLNGWCKGLLEALPGKEADPSSIDYTHRSIAEFLATDQIKAEMAHYVDGFDSVGAISQLFLASQSYFDDMNEQLPGKSGHPTRSYAALMRIRQENGLDSAPPYQFLECLSSLRSLAQWHRVSGTRISSMGLSRSQNGVALNHNLGFQMMGIKTPNDKARDRSQLWIEHPIFIAAFLKNHQYISWKVEKDPDMLTNPPVMAMFTYVLFCLLSSDNAHSVVRFEPDWQFADELLRNQTIDPQVRTEVAPWTWLAYFRWRRGREGLPRSDDSASSSTSGCDPYTGFEATIWEHLLVREFQLWLAPYSSKDNGVYFGKMAELFLKYGATSPSFTATVKVTDQRKGREGIDMTFKVDAEGETLYSHISFRIGDDDATSEPMERNSSVEFRDVSGWDMQDGCPCKTFSVGDWMQYATYEEIPNKDRILELLGQSETKTKGGNSATTVLEEPKPLLKQNELTQENSHSDLTLYVDKKSHHSTRQVEKAITSTRPFIHTSHTPSSVFGVLLVVLIFMLCIEIAL